MKNTIENIVIIIIIMALMFVGLGVYTKIVVSPMLIEAVNKETNKVENNISNEIENKFKKIESLTSNLSTNNTPKSSIFVPKKTRHKDSVLIHKKHLTRKQRRRLLK